MSSQIRAYKQALADQLLADPAFATVPILVKIPKDILNQVEEGTYPVTGIAVFIGGFGARNLNPNLPGPYFDDTTVAVDVVEIPTNNEANPDCDTLGEIAAALIHNEPLDGADENPQVVDWIEVEDKVYSIRRIMVKTPMGWSYQKPAIAPVIPSATVAGNITLTCATPGAPIFTTLDGTYPAPRGGTLYTNPVAVAVGQLLRARAWLAGYGASNPTELNQQY